MAFQIPNRSLLLSFSSLKLMIVAVMLFKAEAAATTTASEANGGNTTRRQSESGHGYDNPVQCCSGGLYALRYKGGNDCVGWHADDEKLYGPTPEIASVSFGSERGFFLKKKPTNSSQAKKGSAKEDEPVAKKARRTGLGRDDQHSWTRVFAGDDTRGTHRCAVSSLQAIQMTPQNLG